MRRAFPGPIRIARATVCTLLLLIIGPVSVRAEPVLRVLDLPFKVRALRGPGSEVALAVATSGLLPILRARPQRDAEGAPIAVAWGEEGGAVLILEEGSVAVRPIGRDAIEGLVAAEMPRGALPGIRRAVAGPLSAFLTDAVRAPDGGPAAASLTIRERQPMAVSTDPKPVPVTVDTLPADIGSVFAPARPWALRMADRPAFLAATFPGPGAGGLALITRTGTEPGSGWSVAARATTAAPLKIVGIAGSGTLTAATVDAGGVLRLWRLKVDGIEPAGEAGGYEGGAAEVDLAAGIAGEASEIALPVAGGTALAVVTVGKGAHERLQIALPAPAASGVAALGTGTNLRLLVGLADGRVVAIAPDEGKP